MSQALERLREKQRVEIESGLREAETELGRLDERRDELVELIASARAWLGETTPQVEVDLDEAKSSRWTLHKAMEVVLREHPEGMRPPELGKEIARRGLYRGREGETASTQQIHARAHNYPKLFRREDGLFFAERSLERVRERLDELRDVARDEYEHYGPDPDGWTLDEFLKGIDRLAEAIEAAERFRPGTRERWEAEKNARNGYAQPLYYRGRRRLATGGLGFFPGKRGDKGVDWEPTDLSRAADRIASEPLRQIYLATATLLDQDH